MTSATTQTSPPTNLYDHESRPEPAAQPRSATRETTPRSASPSSDVAKRAAIPTQKLRPAVPRAEHSKSARPKFAPDFEARRSAREASSSALTPIQHLPQALDFLGINSPVFQQVQNQLFVRIFKKAPHQMPDLRPRSLFLRHQRRVNVRPPILKMSQVPLALE